MHGFDHGFYCAAGINAILPSLVLRKDALEHQQVVELQMQVVMFNSDLSEKGGLVGPMGFGDRLWTGIDYSVLNHWDLLVGFDGQARRGVYASRRAACLLFGLRAFQILLIQLLGYFGQAALLPHGLELHLLYHIIVDA